MEPPKTKGLQKTDEKADLAENGPRVPGIGARVGLFALVFAAALTVYVLTLAPSLTGEDSGELICAAWNLGVAHPPGYPAYVLFGKLIATLLPFHEVAWRLNLASALAAAAAAGITALAALRLTGSLIAGATSGLALAWSLNFWGNAVVAEVYPLNSVFVALLLYAAVRWHRSPAWKIALLAAVAAGFGLGVHPVTAPIALVVMLYAVWRSPKEAFTSKAFLPAAAIGTAVLVLLYGFTMLASRRNPYVDWGNPETLGGLWYHVTRQQYAQSTITSPYSLDLWLSQAGVILDYLARQPTVWICPLACVGLVQSFRKHGGKLGLMLLGVLYVSTFAFMLITYFEIERPKIEANYAFFVPAGIVLAIWIGLAVEGIRAAAARKLNRRASWVIAIAVGLAAVVSPLVFHWRQNDRSRYFVTRNLADNLLENLPADAVYFAQNPIAAFALMYAQGVEGKRPDIDLFLRNANVGIQHSQFKDIKRHWRTPITMRGQAELVAKLGKRAGERPIFFDWPAEELVSRALGNKRSLRPVGLLYQVVDSDDKSWRARSHAVHERLSWQMNGEAVTTPTTDRYHGTRDLVADHTFSKHLYMRGMLLYETGKTDDALRAHKEAVRWARGIKQMPYNCALAAAKYGHPEVALPMLQDALDIDPNYKRAIDLARYLYARPKLERR